MVLTSKAHNVVEDSQQIILPDIKGNIFPLIQIFFFSLVTFFFSGFLNNNLKILIIKKKNFFFKFPFPLFILRTEEISILPVWLFMRLPQQSFSDLNVRSVPWQSCKRHILVQQGFWDLRLCISNTYSADTKMRWHDPSEEQTPQLQNGTSKPKLQG